LAQPHVSAFVTSVVRDFRDRDDVLQDVAVAVIESFDRYDPGRPFVAWAIGIARNQVSLYLRRRRRDRHVFDEQTIGSIEAAFIDAEQSSKLEHLRECVEQLEPRAGQLCALRYREDLKPRAIAKLIGMTPNAVAKALQRIRDLLRACVERKARVEGVGP
jgi:RNA polymerase sigma-70 factor (ECF subfamily)